MSRESDLLTAYNARRDFSKTREPAGTLEAGQGNAFCVQKHDASRLHFDLRLEMDGVLKSWAVTRGPSPDPADKRLAVRTEDHPLAYGEFEGCIPGDQYGGGTVMLWDRGTWSPLKGRDAELEDGKLHFVIAGERMKGEWLLVRMRGKKGDKRENWLLRKVEDSHAGGSDDLVARHLTSVKTGRTMSDIAADEQTEHSDESEHKADAPKDESRGSGKPEADKRKTAGQDKRAVAANKARTKGSRAVARKNPRNKESLPEFRKPQLATLVEAVPEGSGWLHEIKYDGYRCLLAANGGQVKIYTRAGKDWTDRFADIAEAVTALDLPTAMIDGEIVKSDRNGNPDFSALQKALKNGEGGFTLFAFDLLEVDGKDLTALTTLERKQQLFALIPPDLPSIRFADHLVGAGERLLATMCEAGQEGIICKRADAPYQHRRTRNWLKVKCMHRQEFVIIGWRASAKRGRPFASLLLAQHEDDDLVYKGRVGTGFSEDEMSSLATRFKRLTRKTPAASVPASEARDAHWVSPRLVAEIAFAQFTTEGRVRHGSYLGLRTDKSEKDVTPEKALSAHHASPSLEAVHISSRDRVIFPKAGATKGDLADYYKTIASLMLPWIVQRPVSLVRCPQGRGKRCFFQRHNPGSFGEHVKTVPITEKDGNVEDYLYVEQMAGLLACVQMGTIEFHGWGSRVDALERPDRLVFDLDPDEGLAFTTVSKAASDIRRQLEDIGLISFPMLSGGKGIHVVVPLTSRADWAVVKDFASRFARALSQAQPDHYTATMSKQKRKGRIFIDWLRNQRGATSVVPYSARARECAPVAVPVSWEELGDIENAACFAIDDVDSLLERAASPNLRHWGVARQFLPDL